MRPVLFELPWFGGAHIPIHSYGLMIALGFLAAIYLSIWRGRRLGIAPRYVMNAGLFALIGGVLGARIGFIIEKWDQFRSADFWEVFNITGGGLTVTGGIPLAMGLILLYLWRKHIRIHRFLDAIVPAVAIGLIFGRVGCLLNGCCYGKETDLPWALRFPAGSPASAEHYDPRRPAAAPGLLRTERGGPVAFRDLPGHARRMADRLVSGKPLPDHWKNDPFLERFGGKRDLERGAVAADILGRLNELAWSPENLSPRVHPTQVYHMIAGLLMFGMLTVHFRYRRHEGQVAAAFVFLYGAQRLGIEFFRDTSKPMWGGLNPFQLYMIGVMVAGAAWYALVTLRTGPVKEEEIAAEAAKLAEELAALKAGRAKAAAEKKRRSVTPAPKPPRAKRKRR